MKEKRRGNKDPAVCQTLRESVITGGTPVVLPEQAYVVSCILEGIYKSAASGKPFYFENL